MYIKILKIMEKLNSFEQFLLVAGVVMVSLALLFCGWTQINFANGCLMVFIGFLIVDVAFICMDSDGRGNFVVYSSFGEALLNLTFYLSAIVTAALLVELGICYLFGYEFASNLLCLEIAGGWWGVCAVALFVYNKLHPKEQQRFAM